MKFFPTKGSQYLIILFYKNKNPHKSEKSESKSKIIVMSEQIRFPVN